MGIRKGLLAVATVSQWLGILCLVYFVGDTLLAIARDTRISDAVADAVPLSLAGGLGFTLAWSTALVIRGIAQKAARS